MCYTLRVYRTAGAPSGRNGSGHWDHVAGNRRGLKWRSEAIYYTTDQPPMTSSLSRFRGRVYLAVSRSRQGARSVCSRQRCCFDQQDVTHGRFSLPTNDIQYEWSSGDICSVMGGYTYMKSMCMLEVRNILLTIAFIIRCCMRSLGIFCSASLAVSVDPDGHACRRRA